MSKLIYPMAIIMAFLTNLTIVFFKYKTMIFTNNELIAKTLKENIFGIGAIITTLFLAILYICFFVCLNLAVQKNEEKEKINDINEFTEPDNNKL